MTDTISQWLFGIFMAAVLFMLVRPGSPASAWMAALGQTVSGAITTVTAG